MRVHGVCTCVCVLFVSVRMYVCQMIKDKSTWRPAVILQKTASAFTIHYIGWHKKYDECVPIHTDRMRPLVEECLAHHEGKVKSTKNDDFDPANGVLDSCSVTILEQLIAGTYASPLPTTAAVLSSLDYWRTFNESMLLFDDVQLRRRFADLGVAPPAVSVPRFGAGGSSGGPTHRSRLQELEMEFMRDDLLNLADITGSFHGSICCVECFARPVTSLTPSSAYFLCRTTLGHT
jgi:hypothetical protein